MEVTWTKDRSAPDRAFDLSDFDEDFNPDHDDDYEPAFLDSITKPTVTVLTDQVVELLNEAVRIATGGAADRGRPGQEALLLDIWAAMNHRSHMAGRAPTGTGKSLAYLTAAAAAALRGERTVVTTEGLALQNQLMDKDLPVVSKALQRLHDRPLKFAVLKGRSNFACATACVQAANALLDGTGAVAVDSEAPLALAEAITESRPAIRAKGKVVIGGVETRASKLADALLWALPTSIGVDPKTGAMPDPGPLGDFDSAGDVVGDEMRQILSATSDSCLGKDHCEFYDRCRAEAAKNLAAGSDVIVTNHAMLGVQATKAIPVIIGSGRIGRIDHVVADEAHGLPSVVRSQGASDLSGPALRRLVAACTRDTGLPIAQDNEIGKGRQIGERLDEELYEFARAKDPRNAAVGEPIVLAEEDNPIEVTGPLIEKWLTDTKKVLAAHEKQLRTAAVGGASGLKVAASARNSSRDQLIATRKAIARINTTFTDIERARTPEPGVARWMEVKEFRGSKFASVELSPVNVAPSLDRCVWTGYVSEGPDPDEDLVMPPCTEGADTYDLSVSAVSATIPDTFPREAGVKAVPKNYQSPFASSYKASRVYVPALDRDEAAQVTVPRSDGKRRFDIDSHRQWAISQIRQMVGANGGRALVLAATTQSGQAYVEALRSDRPAWRVMSQWDPGTTGQIVARWRSDETAVLVGTKTLFTGVDAPGETCSLVIVDRIPRARMNPVDDARRDTVSMDQQIDKWSADIQVYVSDAAVTLEQGVGRLIRSVSDAGLVAILDPRIGGGATPQLSKGAVAAYHKVLEAFPAENRLRSLDDACHYLEHRRRSK